MRYILIATLLLTSACSSWGNDPASQFANVTYGEEYLNEMLNARLKACKANIKFCDDFNVTEDYHQQFRNY